MNKPEIIWEESTQPNNPGWFVKCEKAVFYVPIEDTSPREVINAEILKKYELDGIM